MSFEVFFNRRRTESQVITLYQEGGTLGLTLNLADVVRFKMYRRDQATPILDVDSVAATSGGSVIVITQVASAAVVTLTMGQEDLNIDPGTYESEVSVVDSGDGYKIKLAELGVVHVLGTGGGDIGAN